ncbi:hypothetical protein BPAE_0015g00180 [Botrytis paeoniae]|uniref:Uncharacterized protein n=1 Tax=Botrytis paeoniae TaxID=278948 RepID=A0A4Z1FX24_9HELO|nr:hypothetical protein BPAE_0015g00180 [Botrytis paeoniae]
MDIRISGRRFEKQFAYSGFVVVVDRNDDDKTSVASSHDDFVFPSMLTIIPKLALIPLFHC